MKTVFALFCLWLLPTLVWAAPTWRVAEVDMDDLQRPVGAFCYEDALFTSNQGTDPAKGDGFILKYNINDYAETKFLDGKLFDPKGFVIVRNRILVIDQNLQGAGQPGLILADLKRDRILAEVTVPDAGVLYGVAALNSSNYIITDNTNNRLYTVTDDEDKLTITPWVMDIYDASGICLHDSFIFIAGSALDEKTQQIRSGSLYQVDPFTTVTQRFITLTQTAKGYLNALAGHRGYLFATDWSGESDQDSATVYVISTSSKRRVARIDVPQGVYDIGVWGNALYLTFPATNKVLQIDLDFDSLGN